MSWEEIEERKIKWFGSLAKSGVFSVKSFCSSLKAKGEVPFPLKLVWGSWAPTKVSILTWERILTMDQLKRRGWVLVSYCCMCKKFRRISRSSSSSIVGKL